MWVFISHSTDRSDAGGLKRLLAFRRELRHVSGKRTHDVLLDLKRLDTGSKWRGVLHDWMSQCNAAVLLLTPRALESPWVLQEATILTHRAARCDDGSFRLFPVLLDGVTPQQLSQPGSPFSVLLLQEIQKAASTDPAAVAALVQGFLESIEGKAETTPLDQLIEKLVVPLASARGKQLESICSRVTGKPVFWDDEKKRTERCARDLAKALVAGKTGPFASALDLVEQLRSAGLTKEESYSVLNLLAPLWVDLGAAAPLAEVAVGNLDVSRNAASQAKRRAVALNGQFVPSFTAEMYMRRVYLPTTFSLYSVEGGDGEDRFESLKKKIRDEFRIQEGLRSEGEVDARLKTLRAPYFVVLPPPVPDPQLMTELHKVFPNITFIAHEDETDVQLRESCEHVLPLRPAVDVSREALVFDRYGLVRRRIKDS